MAGRKDDPMYYREKIKKLILEAEQNGLKVYADNTKSNVYVYFEAHECEIWGVKVPKNKGGKSNGI